MNAHQTREEYYDHIFQHACNYIGQQLLKQEQTELLGVWRSAKFSFSLYDQVHYDCTLDHMSILALLPPVTFANVEKKIPRWQKYLLNLVRPSVSHIGGLHLEGVTIGCDISRDESWRQEFLTPPEVSSSEADEIWDEDLLRLFVSHRSEVKLSMEIIKKELRFYGISAFIAHRDITETKEWLGVIKSGLASCHCLAAVSTEKFQESDYCHQECGWVLGRGGLVLPVLAGESPRGIYAEIQGVTCRIEDPQNAACKIARALTQDPRTRPGVYRGVAALLEKCQGGQEASEIIQRIVNLQKCSRYDLDLVHNALSENARAMTSYKLPAFNMWLSERQAPSAVKQV